MLMKKLVSPNLDLMPKGNKVLEQIKNMDSKQRQEMFSSLLPNTFFGKTKKKKLPGAPFDEKFQFQEKLQQSSIDSFAIGWSGQATTKSLKPIVEVASKYPFDIDSAFFDYTDITKLNTKKSGKENIKKLKKVSHKRIKKTSRHASGNKTKAKKSVQLLKEIPKSHVSKLCRLNAERRERALRQSVLEPPQGVYISDSPSMKSTTEVTDSKFQLISADIDVNNNSDTKYQLVKDTVSSSVEKTEFQDEKEFKNTVMADNWEESSQNDHSQRENQINGINEKSQDFETHGERFITNQICGNKNISPETNREKQNSDEFVLTKLEGKLAGIKYHQKNVDDRPASETAHQVSSTTNNIGSIFPKISKYDDINLAKVKDLEIGNEMENNPHSSINDSQTENYSYLYNENTNDSAVKADADQINQLPLSNKPTKNKGKGISEENLSLITNKSMNSDSTCVNRQTNHRLDQILGNISLTNTPIKYLEKENNCKELSTLSHKKQINLNQLQCLKNTRSPVRNEVVYSKLLKKEEEDLNIDTSFTKSSNKVKKYKKVEIGNIYKQHLSKNVDVTEETLYNNNKSLRDVKEGCVVSKSHKKNKKTSETDLLKDLSNSLILRTELGSPTNTAQKVPVNNKSTETLAKKNKSYHILSPKSSRRRQKGLSKIDAKICMIKVKDSKVDANRTYPYLTSLNKENKGSSKLKNNKPMLLKSKQIEDSYNKSDVIDPKRLTSTTEEKFKEIVKKPKSVVLVESNYVKFVENKAWFLGSPSNSLQSKPENNSINEETKENPKDSLKLLSLKLSDVRVQNKEKIFTKEASLENINNSKELKEIQANKKKLDHNLEKCSNLKKRILKIKTGIKDPKTNKTFELLRKVKSSRKVLDSNVQQAVNKLEQKQNNSICTNFEKPTANRVDGKVSHNFNNARSTLTRKIELVSKKTKPSVQLSKSLFEVSKSVFSKGNNSDDLSSKNNARKDSSTPLCGIEVQSAKPQNILNYNAAPVSTKKFKRTRKLHSRKLGSKYSDLKMYGEEKNILPLSHVRSLKSTQVVHKNCINKTNEVSSLETRNSLARNFRSEMRQSSKKIFPIAVQNRNLYTVQDTPHIMVSYLCKRLLTTTAAKNIENYYLDLSNTVLLTLFKEKKEW